MWKVSSYLPFRVSYFLSSLTYYPIYYLIRYRRKVTRGNLIKAFPEKDIKEIVKIEKRFYRFFSDMFAETCKFATISPKEIKKRMRFTNIEEVSREMEAGKSLTIFMGHYACWEWVTSLPLWLDSRFVSGQIYKRLSNWAVDKLMLTNRERFGATSVEMKQTMRWTHEQLNNKTVSIMGYIADQSPRKNNTEHFLNFMHQYVPTYVGAEKITKRYGFGAYFLEIKRVKRGYYEATFVRLHDDPQSLPDYELTDLYYNKLEELISSHPEYYLWTHKRFRYAKN
ncbi:lysophospholipid acyltransferase family protein [Bacteroidales bacterium OttesenSCG-928-J19]|nr:lysophospholipid acyltransferase family protein [Bacteroidales bacterium OttesenSCG-928-J19]